VGSPVWAAPGPPPGRGVVRGPFYRSYRTQADVIAEEYNRHISQASFQHLFGTIESTFRLIVRALEPTACKNGAGEFESIYKWLLKKINLQQCNTFLHLLRLIRNTVHNNGVYFHASGKNEQVSYNGVTYSFQQAHAIDFLTWPLYLDNLIPDVEALLLAVVEAPTVAAIARIEDPFSQRFPPRISGPTGPVAP